MDRRHWLKAFPIQEASKAVEVVLDGWKDLSSRNSAKFCHTEKEPKLTTMLRLYIKDYKAMNAGLLGQWGAEQTEGMLDLTTLEITKRHRTDIHYAWHDQSTRHEIIFEFKKLSHTKSSRDLYYSKEGKLCEAPSIISDGWYIDVSKRRLCSTVKKSNFR